METQPEVRAKSGVLCQKDRGSSTVSWRGWGHMLLKSDLAARKPLTVQREVSGKWWRQKPHYYGLRRK